MVADQTSPPPTSTPQTPWNHMDNTSQRETMCDPRLRHTKDIIKMVPDASLLGAQHIRTGLASLSSQTSFKKKDMDTIQNEWSRVINISWDNLFHNRP